MAKGLPVTSSQSRSDRALVATYHEAKLADLLERVHEDYAAYDAGLIDAFQLDGILQRYGTAARALGTFCEISDGQVEAAARKLKEAKKRGKETDWWDDGGLTGR